MLPELRKENEAERMASIESFVKISAAFQRVFDNSDGEAVIKYLKIQTPGFDKDPYQHAFNAGKRRVLEIIEQMQNKEEYRKHLEVVNAQSKTT